MTGSSFVDPAGATGSAPGVSVVIPTLGSSTVLAEVLDRLADQVGLDLQAMELVVVVDGTGTPAAEQLRAQERGYDLRVVEIIHSGTAGARDAGWRAARAPLIVFLDDDVVPGPRLVAEHLEAQRVNGPCVVLGRIEPPAGRRRPWVAYDDRVMAKKYDRLERRELPSGIHYGGNVSLPRPFLQAAGGHDHVLQHDADVELGDRLRAAGVRFVYRASAQGVHHGSPDYRGWRRRHSLLGRWDVVLRRDRGLSGGLAGLLACYYDRHPLNRLAIRLGLGQRTSDQGGAADLLALCGSIAYGLRLYGVSFWAFSAAANLLYWSGVRDGMRGSAAFWRGVRAVRSHRGRPYLERGR
jgi:GT2 family glycosyltransferase